MPHTTFHIPRLHTAASSARTRRPDEPVVIFARWAGYVGGRAQQASPQGDRAHIYSSSILPTQPLQIGMRVRILATSPAWYTAPEEEQDVYDAYDAHVVGTISGVVGWKGRKVVLELENECAVNTVRSVRIRIPFAPEATVSLGASDVPEGHGEAFESDLNTTAVVRVPPEDATCGAGACCTPWRSLVGEGFLWEPMTEDVGERPGDRGGRRKVPRSLVGWGDVAV